MVNRIIKSLSMLIACSVHVIGAYEVVFVEPVADLFINKQPDCVYDPAYAEYKGHSGVSCFRSTQALFNEQGFVVSEDGDMCCVRILNAYYVNDGKKHSTYWTHRSNILPITQETLGAIPDPISFADPTSVMAPDVITLVRPYTCLKTARTYSAGTRFMYAGNKTEKSISVLIFDPDLEAVHTCEISQVLCAPTEKKTLGERKKYFVHLLKQWCKNMAIPYVWGGTSIVTSVAGLQFEAVEKTVEGKKLRYWVWPTDELPRTGCDCSGLVLRAAQIASIPYFCRNTLTMANTLRSRDSHEKIEEGDLIYFPGHVMIVSDVMHNKIIEAVGYSPSRFGYVHEISLHKRFKGIRTFAQLQKACAQKQKITILTKAGTKSVEIDQCRIVRF